MTGIPAGPLPPYAGRALAGGLGGVILFGRNVEDASRLRALTGQIRRHGPRALIAIDEEGGPVGRLAAAGVRPYPGNLALGVLDDTEVTRRVAFDMACVLAGFGINVDFAPCADVNTNAANPVIGVRSFGSAPDLVARHARAFTDGLQSRGVAACLKHFPGHGDTSVDSHLALPEGTAELTPFAGSTSALLMSAHVRYPSLDAVPATLSHAILTGIARERLGYDGVIVTDALEMRAISDRLPLPEAAVRALIAGADLVLTGSPCTEPELDALAAAITAAVTEGRLPADRVADAGRRVAALAARFAAPDPRPAPDGQAASLVATTLAARQRPPRLAPGCVAIELGRQGLAALAAARDPAATVLTLDAPPAGLPAVLRQAEGRPLLAAAPDPGALAPLLSERPDATVIVTGLPAPVPGRAGAVLYSYGTSPVLLGALLDLLLPAV